MDIYIYRRLDASRVHPLHLWKSCPEFRRFKNVLQMKIYVSRILCLIVLSSLHKNFHAWKQNWRLVHKVQSVRWRTTMNELQFYEVDCWLQFCSLPATKAIVFGWTPPFCFLTSSRFVKDLTHLSADLKPRTPPEKPLSRPLNSPNSDAKSS